jgi:hypothetical protein
MALFFIFFGVIILLLGLSLSLNLDKNPIDDNEAFLVQNYHKKPNYKQRLVLIIEDTSGGQAKDHNVSQLVTLIKNILNQTIKVDSIILISQNEEKLKKVQLIHNTCLIQKMGGLSFLLKESGKETTIVYIFYNGFNGFSDPQFLKHFLETNKKINGLLKVENDSVKIDVAQVYHNHDSIYGWAKG